MDATIINRIKNGMMSSLSGNKSAVLKTQFGFRYCQKQKNNTEYCGISMLLDYKNIFIVSFHQVLLPGNFFHPPGICFEQLYFLAGIVYLFFVVFLAFFQIIQLSSVLYMQKNIVVVKEQHPYHKKYSRNQKFVLK